MTPEIRELLIGIRDDEATLSAEARERIDRVLAADAAMTPEEHDALMEFYATFDPKTGGPLARAAARIDPPATVQIGATLHCPCGAMVDLPLDGNTVSVLPADGWSLVHERGWCCPKCSATGCKVP